MSAVSDSNADATVDGANRPASSAVSADASTERGRDAAADTLAVAVPVESINGATAGTGRDKRRSMAARISICAVETAAS